jgi:hypothetical protein
MAAAGRPRPTRIGTTAGAGGASPLLDGDESSAPDELAVSMPLSISMTLAVEGLDDEDE